MKIAFRWLLISGKEKRHLPNEVSMISMSKALIGTPQNSECKKQGGVCATTLMRSNTLSVEYPCSIPGLVLPTSSSDETWDGI